MSARSTAPIVRRVFGHSVVGSSHRATNAPNQDALDWLPKPGRGSNVVLCVSDGHGSRACFRSDVGARLGVKVALAVGQDFLDSLDGSSLSVGNIERAARETLPRRIVAGWAERVREDLEVRPFGAEELEGAGLVFPADVRDPLLPYGATLLMGLLTTDLAVLLQLGDGDIITVFPDGAVQSPLPSDDQLVAGETVSLCSPNAVANTRVRCLDLTGNQIAILLLATDGYGNSFADLDWRPSVGNDFLSHLYEHGPAWIDERLKSWLAESADIAGDDVTVGMVAAEGLVAPAERPARRVQVEETRTEVYSSPGFRSESRPLVRGEGRGRPNLLAGARSRLADPSTSDIRVSWNGVERVYHPGQVVTFGRDSACTLRTDNPLVSRQHARLECQLGDWILVDLGSSQGTHDDDGGRVRTLPVRRSVVAWLGPVGSGERMLLDLSAEQRPPAVGRVAQPGQPERPSFTTPYTPRPAPAESGPPPPSRPQASRPPVHPGPERVHLPGREALQSRPVSALVGAALIALALLILLVLFLTRSSPAGVSLRWIGTVEGPTCVAKKVKQYPAGTQRVFVRVDYDGLDVGETLTFTPESGGSPSEMKADESGCAVGVLAVPTPGSFGVTVAAAGHVTRGTVRVRQVAGQPAGGAPGAP